MPEINLSHGIGNLSVGISDAEIQQVTQALGGLEKNAQAIVRSAINETLKHGVTIVVNELKAVLNVNRVRDIREHVTIKQKATDGELVGIIRIDYRAIALLDFKAKFRKNNGVTVTTIKGGTSENFKHMFRAKMQSGHVGIFEREIFVPKRVPTQGRYAPKVIGPRARVEGQRYRNRRTKRLVRREPGTGSLRQSIKEAFGPSALAAFEKTPDLVDHALSDLGEYLQDRINSKVTWQIEKLSIPPST